MTHVGRNIGRYRILEEVGSGGMSVVYKGLDTSLDREVAVKVLHPHLAGKEESRRRLAREAKAVAKLHHPNILEVFDYSGADSQDAYIVTEYIRGQTLKQFADQHPIPLPELAAMALHEISAALAHAHLAGVLHRDLKPENVMVRFDGVLKLMDFGIAKIIDRDDKMTMTGALVGSPAHMAPEIINGETAGTEADVFSLGTLLFYLVTHRLPFSGPNTTSTLKKILDGVYDDPRQLTPTLSDDLAAIIARCLARTPSDRYRSASELQTALAEYLSALGIDDVGASVRAYFLDTNAYPALLKQQLVDALMARAKKQQTEGRTARSLGTLNNVLALDPKEPRALAQLERMNVSRARKKFVKRAGLLTAGTLALLALTRAHREQKPPDALTAPRPAIARTGSLAESRGAATEGVSGARESASDTGGLNVSGSVAGKTAARDPTGAAGGPVITGTPGSATAPANTRESANSGAPGVGSATASSAQGSAPPGAPGPAPAARSNALAAAPPSAAPSSAHGSAPSGAPGPDSATRSNAVGSASASTTPSSARGSAPPVVRGSGSAAPSSTRGSKALGAPRLGSGSSKHASVAGEGSQAPVPVKLHIRPYGAVRLDGSPNRSEQLPFFALHAQPGSHKVTLSCDRFCEDADRTIEVTPEGPNEFFLTPSLRPARLTFEFLPADAVVAVRGESFAVSATRDAPIEIRTSNVRNELRHEVEYEITAPGYSPRRATLKAIPGETLVIKGQLQPL
jgi:eukaryotic-like serine/threonine-protein kinase